ncbi:threonine--tRNA ligase [Candidatus Saccharibacteria bacterium]|nr:threonine--tRNA ligase [Candidatus Saccharibacteria bacterium]
MENSEQLHKLRHSLAHIMASAVQNIKPEASFGVGPAIDSGFYYDFLADENFTESELKSIEKEMRSIINQKLPFEQENWPIDEAIKYFESKNQKFKVELLNDLKTKGTTAVADAGDDDLAKGSEAEVKEVSIYKTGDFVDLCRGPHVENTSEIQADSFKLNRTSGVYWRGKEENPQMQRVYGLAFETKERLNEYLQMLVEAEKRDHRKLGQELDLFVFSDMVGVGLPLFTPRGTILREMLNDFSQSLRLRNGFEKVWIPHITKTELYEKSGHWDKFGDELFLVKSQESSDEFALKPMNCPHHQQIYASKPRSYRDLPIKYLETTTIYRDEKKGELLGLSRVRSATQDDSHVFCTPEQVNDVLTMLIDITKEFYQAMGLSFSARLSLRDESDAYLGDKKLWESAENSLRQVSKSEGLEFYEEQGEAAFYGPKIDFMAKDSLGRTHQVATAQLDFVQPGRFELTYTDKDGSEKTPVMIHFASLGSIERFLSVYIEHTAGAFPLWLAPEQVRIIPVSDKFSEYAKSVHEKLDREGVRVKLDDDSESLGKRIRTAEKLKVPMIMVVGEKEQESNSVAIRRHGVGDEGSKDLDEAVSSILEEISTRKV